MLPTRLRFAWPHHLENNWSIAKRIYAAIARQPPELNRPPRLATAAPRRLSIADAPRALALTNLGQVLLHAERRVDGAASCFERANELDPECGEAWIGLAEIAHEDAPDRAEPLFRRASELLPEQRPRLRWELLRLRAELCDWRRWDADVDELTQFVATAEVEIPPFDLNHFPISPDLHLRAAQRHAANLARARRGHIFRHPVPAQRARQRRRVACPAELATLRGKLNRGIAESALFDLPRFVGGLEEVYSRVERLVAQPPAA